MFKIHRLPKYWQDWFQVMRVHTSFANIASILGLFFIIIFWVLAQICFLHVILSINSIIIIGFFIYWSSFSNCLCRKYAFILDFQKVCLLSNGKKMTVPLCQLLTFGFVFTGCFFPSCCCCHSKLCGKAGAANL